MNRQDNASDVSPDHGVDANKMMPPATDAPTYDRQLIAEMLGDLVFDDGYGQKSRSCYTVEAIKEQHDALLAADSAAASRIRTTATPPAGGRDAEALAMAERLQHEAEIRTPKWTDTPTLTPPWRYVHSEELRGLLVNASATIRRLASGGDHNEHAKCSAPESRTGEG